MSDTRKPPEMTAVQSSNIAAAGYDGTALWIRFRDSTNKAGTVTPGGLYRYPTAGADLHAGLLAAESAGRYFHQSIRGHHTGEKVE